MRLSLQKLELPDLSIARPPAIYKLQYPNSEVSCLLEQSDFTSSRVFSAANLLVPLLQDLVSLFVAASHGRFLSAKEVRCTSISSVH